MHLTFASESSDRDFNERQLTTTMIAGVAFSASNAKAPAEDGDAS